MREFLTDVPKYGRQIISGNRFKQCDRAKVHKTEYQAIVTDNVYFGRLDVSEAILKQHKANPYRTVDELIGDLQIILMESYNAIKSNSSIGHKISIEDLVEKPKTTCGGCETDPCRCGPYYPN